MTANCSSSAPQRRAFALSLSNICGRLAALGLRPARDRCCATLDATTRDDLRNTALPAATSDAGLNCGICWGLTFDMRGGRQLAKPDVARPLDGRVRRRGRWRATTLPRRDDRCEQRICCPCVHGLECARVPRPRASRGKAPDLTSKHDLALTCPPCGTCSPRPPSRSVTQRSAATRGQRR